MSTNIYNGIRIPLEKIAPFTAWYRKKCFDHLEVFTRDLMTRVEPKELRKRAKEMKGVRGKVSVTKFLAEPKNEEFVRLQVALELYEESMQRGRNFVNPACWFNAFMYRKWFLIKYEKPFGMKLSRFPKYVEPYAYWTGTDPDEDVPAKEWRERERAWNKVVDKHNPYRLNHLIIDKDDNVEGTTQLCAMIMDDSFYQQGWLPSFTARVKVNGEIEEADEKYSVNSKLIENWRKFIKPAKLMKENDVHLLVEAIRNKEKLLIDGGCPF